WTPRMLITDAGDVGIGTTGPAAKLDVRGDLHVTGAYRGNITSSSGSDGAPFPRPAYDSGWVHIPRGESVTFTHNIGGSIDNYVVDVCFFDTDTGPYSSGYHISGIGGMRNFDNTISGAAWNRLTNQSIRVYRWDDDVNAVRARVRIWVYN
ncbi:MAG: hypothetical protein JSV84_05450, partial [Gemmatimonadota bacterium]